MKTQIKNTQLGFNKNSMVELNDLQLRSTDSGGTPFLVAGIAIGAAGMYLWDQFDGDND